MKSEFIAYCGLDCESCEARLVTINNDDERRKKVAELWSKLNGVEITPEMINCTGCRLPGVKTPYCEKLCSIRKCASNRKYETCGDCIGKDSCDELAVITGNNPEAKKNLL